MITKEIANIKFKNLQHGKHNFKLKEAIYIRNFIRINYYM